MTFRKALVPAALAATLGTAALAENAFFYQEAPIDAPSGTITINGVNADADGVVAIYEADGDMVGDLLGMTEIFAGANSDVIVDLERPAQLDLIAVLYAGEVSSPDMGVATLEIDLES